MILLRQYKYNAKSKIPKNGRYERSFYKSFVRSSWIFYREM